MPDTISLEINVEWWGRESIGAAEVGQNTKVGVLGGHISQCALIRFWRNFFIRQPYISTNPLHKNAIGFSRIKHVQTIIMW